MACNPVTLIGCGPQAKYVMEILARTDRAVFQVLDPIGRRIGESIGGFTIQPFKEAESLLGSQDNRVKCCITICLSDNRFKGELFKKFDQLAEIINAIHPESTIASTAKLESGLIINANAVIQPYARLGHGCMIHSGVIIEHDCVVENFVNLAPGVVLAGGVKVGEGTTVCTGAVVVPNVKIGKYSVIGGGSLVLQDIPDRVLAYGTPARIIKELDE
jgi:UDP-perosamine 4-acetyltransferase